MLTQGPVDGNIRILSAASCAKRRGGGSIKSRVPNRTNSPETNYIVFLRRLLSRNRVHTKQPSTGFQLIRNRAWIHG